MLEPRARRLLLDALRPPDGYALGHAVGTTYSLDLLALLVAPLAFSMFEVDEDEGRADPLALFAALRRHAGRVTLFCEAGRIAVPARHQPLFGYLEEAVYEATAPASDRAFHPKVWVLRFVADGKPVKYRVLCLSRNLTFDRSWDTALALDGELTDRKSGITLNRPLSDFVAALPSLAREPLPEPRASAIAVIVDELRRVRFEPPDGLELVRFWPLGVLGHTQWPFGGRIDRLLVVSPFLGTGCLGRLSAGRGNCALVSRSETLSELPHAALAGFDPVFQLSPFAEPAAEPGDALSGLHAKVYVADAGREARVWTGSANATDAAFNGNVEFLVELKGMKSACGIDAMLRQGAAGESFRGLLEEFVPRAATEPDPVRVRLEAALEAARRALVGAGFRAVLTPRDEPDEFALAVVPRAGGALVLPPGVTVTCRPVSVAAGMVTPVQPGRSPTAAFARLSAAALTRFFAFEVVAADGPATLSAGFVLTLPLDGAPADRADRLLFHVLSDRRAVLRLIRLLLADGGADAAALLAAWEGGDARGEGQAGAGSGFEVPLFETLVRALDRNPAKLDEVAALFNELTRTAEGRALLPDRFETIWEPIWSARQELPR